MVPVNTLAVGEGRDEASSRRAGASSGSGIQRIPGGTQDQGDGRNDFHAARLDPAEIGTFGIIYADPPWAYRETVFKGEKGTGTFPGHSAARMHYQTMKTEDICVLTVQQIADRDCLLFLWATSPNLPEAFRVLTSWGFKYATVAYIWDKQRVNPGYYTMSQCEMVLVAKRGKIPQPRGARNIRQLLSEKASGHSRKPEEIRHRIEAMFPEQRKIELFARGKPAPGWVAWGEEVQP